MWGTSDPGEKLVVTLASSSREIVASSNGHWEVVLPKMSVGGPFLLAVRGKTTITLKDVMQVNLTFLKKPDRADGRGTRPIC